MYDTSERLRLMPAYNTTLQRSLWGWGWSPRILSDSLGEVFTGRLPPTYALISHSERANGPPEHRHLRRLLDPIPVTSRRVATFCTLSHSHRCDAGRDVTEGEG